MNKLRASIGRSIIAVIIIAVGALLGCMAIHWQEWCPNNGLGMIIVLVTYAGAIIVTGYGIYLISPIYIGIVGHKLIEDMLEKIVIIEYEEDDYEEEEEYEERFQEKILNLQKKYLW